LGERTKDGIELGKINNQKFVQNSTSRLKDRIAQTCKQFSISFIETEESYTSAASFLDGDVHTYLQNRKGGNHLENRVARTLQISM